MKKQRKLWMIGTLCGIFIIGIGLFFLFQTQAITFNKSVEIIEVNSIYDANEFIKSIDSHRKDVDIDNSDVDVSHVGNYKIKYRIGAEEYTLDVKVVDTVAPEFDVVRLELPTNTTIEAGDFTKNIKDQTETKVSFDKEYQFNKAGDLTVGIIVEDMGGNKTRKETNLKLVDDHEKPILTGLQNYNVVTGTKINYLNGVNAKDNFDKDPKIDIDSSSVDVSKVGTYSVKYTVRDKSGNENIYKKTVTVVKQKKVATIPASKDKIVYLTFDDGPSANTAKVLDVLDKYNAKATFFVTGNGQKYNHLIKSSSDKGHTIALHTYTHNYKSVYASVDNYFSDLNRIGNMVKGITGYFPKYIRFPGGASNSISRQYSKGIMTTLTSEVQKRGFQYYDWNVSSGDAAGNNVPVSKIVKNSTSSHANNIMILFHDTTAKNTTVQALPQIIEHYQTLGYTFKGVDDSTFTCHHGVNN